MKYVPWILVVVMFFATGFTVNHYRNAARDTEIKLQNAKAANDTTMRVLRERVAAATRLAVQARIEAEDLSEAMSEALDDREAALVSLQSLEIQLDSLRVIAQTPRVDTVLVENGDTVRVATFVHEGPPIVGEQTVRVARRITLDSRLAVSPFSLSYGVACADTAPVFSWETPDWVTANFQQGQVDPGVCYDPSTSLFQISTGKTVWLILGIGLGLGIGSF